MCWEDESMGEFLGMQDLISHPQIPGKSWVSLSICRSYGLTARYEAGRAKPIEPDEPASLVFTTANKKVSLPQAEVEGEEQI